MSKKRKDKDFHLDTENVDIDFVRKDGDSDLEIDTKVIDVKSTKIAGKRKTKITIDKEFIPTLSRITKQIVTRVIKRN
jgi:hypothetical protein